MGPDIIPETSYRRSRRRLLVDMQIPDWDPALLRRFDPAAAIAACKAAGASATMLYFQSHTGLCNWPTSTGRQHGAFVGRDVMAELLAEARGNDLGVCAYYSMNFNNWAWETFPEWRLVPAVPSMIGGGLLQRERYGICCFNSRGYRTFARAQATEILERYDVDAFFYDMVWWMSVCICAHCAERFHAECGERLPEKIDWMDPLWCRFQAARERWLVELACELRDTARAARPGINVYHNFAVGLANWTRALPFESTRGHDFLGGDFYGGRDEQLVVSRLMLNLSQSRPVEFMTTVTANLAEHERLKDGELLTSQGLAAMACGAAFLVILGIDPEGEHNASAVARIATAFARCAPYEPHVGGEPIEEIAVYFSGASKMSFLDNGLPLAQAPVNQATDYPHLHAVQGACRILQQAHLPFGIVTRRQLADLSRYPVIILPNVLRMDEEEVDAFRAYVHAGGRLYASRYTSLTSTAGRRAPDFMLADVLGCHFESIENGRNLYLRPAGEREADMLAGERMLSHWIDARHRTGAVRLRRESAAKPLFHLSVPYGYPSLGTVGGKDWSSIHSFPPWEHMDLPTVVTHEFGGGRAIYSAADLESGGTTSHDTMFLALVRSLLDRPPAFEADAHPAVWMTAFDQPDRSRWVITFLNPKREGPLVPVPPFSVRCCAPTGRRFVALRRLPEGAALECLIGPTGTLEARVTDLAEFAMFEATYA